MHIIVKAAHLAILTRRVTTMRVSATVKLEGDVTQTQTVSGYKVKAGKTLEFIFNPNVASKTVRLEISDLSEIVNVLESVQSLEVFELLGI